MYLALPEHKGESDLGAAERILREMGFLDYDNRNNIWTRETEGRTDTVWYEGTKFYQPRSKAYCLTADCTPLTMANGKEFADELINKGFEIVKPFGEMPPSRDPYD
jgi:hypothetical protein